MMLTDYKKLNNGVNIPPTGFGTWKIKDSVEAVNSVKLALQAGYRLIDTAKMYENEEYIGKAIRESGIKREDIFVTTKLWNEDQAYETALAAFERSLKNLGLEYVDLYLVHWPFYNWETKENKRKEAWKAMEEIYASGRAKAIGVCNYNIKHLEEMKTYAKVNPMVNQFEMHPFYYQPELLDYCEKNNIVVEAYSPLAQGKRVDDERITNIAKKYNKSNAQILLRWCIQKGAVPIPKSAHKERIEENLNIFDFEISLEDMSALDSLNERQKQTNWNPDLVP
ncbi:MAG: aldo/keto reductase [Candidatus Doudnabacteria bacterium]|nr:aldo/keto reductase [Candidatus Doudnabacteria bacterium]